MVEWMVMNDKIFVIRKFSWKMTFQNYSLLCSFYLNKPLEGQYNRCHQKWFYFWQFFWLIGGLVSMKEQVPPIITSVYQMTLILFASRRTEWNLNISSFELSILLASVQIACKETGRSNSFTHHNVITVDLHWGWQQCCN